MRGLPAVVAFLAVCLLQFSSGGPISSVWDQHSSHCATKCLISQRFQYARGRTYEFDYLAETATSMEDASEDTARLSIAATALVYVINDCDMVLQLRDVRVQESDPESPRMRNAPDSAMAATILERQPLRFSFQDGVVEELCPSEREELWALNVKRGVLSVFQNSMNRLDSDQSVTEVDVSGRCPAQYQVESNGWYFTTVKRSKDLLACTGRHGYQTLANASPYLGASSMQSLPLMKSSHECHQTLDQHGILSSATCRETHQFRPFSREASGAITKVSQTLKYKTVRYFAVDVLPVSQRVSLTYDHGSQEEITHKAQQEAEEVLRQLCEDTRKDIRPDTPGLFSSLVSVLRRVDAVSLEALDSSLEHNTQCASNPRTKKFFVDALPMVGSDASVALMTRKLMSQEVKGLQADMWLTSLALIQEPSPAMLQAVKVLVKSPTLGQKSLLPVSTMLNNLCQHRPGCSQLPVAQALMTSLSDVISSSCYVSDRTLDQVLMGLRAIGNAGHVTSGVEVVNQCIRGSSNPIEVRVAAAQAFRRMPCDADRSAVTSIMEDRREDSELRIAAYLAVMTCPDDVTLRRVQRLLESETDQQVGSFVWSHLSNLQETSSPHKQAVRELLKNVQLPGNFDLGRLQFSRNYEGSAFLQRLNSGAAAESNLVWSSSSSLPRSLSANLTVDLFGQSLNLLDFGLRLEGLEYLMETVLGPYGYFGQDGKGQSKGQLDEVKGWLYMRMMGNEMSFQRFQGLSSLSSIASFNMLDFLIKLSDDHQVSLTKSMEFLDTSLTVPTTCGLPLALTVRGTASADLQASGTMDFKQLYASPKTLRVDGLIRPSAAVQLSGQMWVDARVSRAALQMTATLHTSSALSAHLDLDKGRVLSVELDVPEDKMELLDISSEFSIVHNKVAKKQRMIQENRQKLQLCTGEGAARLTGLELCGEVQFPNASMLSSGPYFPFTGPSKMSLVLHKRDTHSGYKLLAKRVENKKKTMAQLSFNTPGSSVDRSLALDLLVNHDDSQLQVSAASPWKKVEFKGDITNTKKVMGISGSFVTDDVNVYAVTTEVTTDESKSGVTYTPRLEIQRPGSDDVSLTGTVSLQSKSAALDLTLNGLTSRPWTLKSALTNTPKEVSLTGSVANGDNHEYSVRVGTQMNVAKRNVKIQMNPFLSVTTPSRQLVTFTGSGLYSEGKLLRTEMTFTLLGYKPITAQLTAAKSERKSLSRYTSKATLNSPLVSGSVSSTVSVKKGRLVSGRASVSYSVPRSLRDRLDLVAKLSDRSTRAYRKYTLQSSLESKRFPDYNAAVRMSLDHKKKLSAAELQVQYGKDPSDKSRRLALSGSLSGKIKNLYNVDLSYKVAAEAPRQNVDFKIQGSHLHNSQALESSLDLSLDKKKAYSAALTLGNKSGKLTKLNGELILKAPGADLNLQTSLDQVSRKQWEHSGSLRTADSKHSINSVYQTRGSGSHHLTSTLALQGLDPLTLSSDVDLDPNDLRLVASLQHGKNTYGVSGSHKLARSRNGKWSLEVSVPSRRVTFNANAGKVKGNYEGSLEAAWDADRDPNAKVSVSGMAGSKSSQDFSSHKARLAVSSPLQALGQLEISVGLDSSDSQHKVTARLDTGDDQVTTSTLVVTTPVSPGQVELDFKAETPYRGYRNMGLSLNHRLDDSLSTKLTLTLEKDQCDVSLSARRRGGEAELLDLSAQLDVRSTLGPRSLQSLSLLTDHKVSGGQLDSGLKVTVNRELYSYSLHGEQETGKCTGELTLVWPQDQLTTTWTHRHSSSEFSSSMTSSWSSKERLQVDVSGAHAPGSISGILALHHSSLFDWRAEVNSQYGSGRLMSFSSVKEHNREVFSHGLSVSADASKTDAEFSMTSPWAEPMSGKVKADYRSYPMSASAEFSWAPRQKVTAEGSVTLNNWDDLDLRVRLTSPVRGMRALAATASSKLQGDDVIGEVNVDLGMRKRVVLTTNVRRDLGSWRLKLSTPWSQLSELEAGLDTNLQSLAGKVKADFKAVPAIGRYEAMAIWDVGDDLSAKFRLDTPRQDFPYLQILASNKEKRNSRQSRLELEYSPSHTYSLDSTYSFQMPIMVDLQVATPLRRYESMAASFRTNLKDSAWDASAQMTFNSDQVLKATSMVDWSTGLDSRVTLTTPYPGWEDNWAVLQHKGQWDDFNSGLELVVGGMDGQRAGASLRFLHKMKTDVRLTVLTPWAGWEKLEALLSRKGDLSSLRGSASLEYGGHKMEASVNNKWNSRRARTVASLSTPYTQDLKVKWELTSDLQAKTSFSYGPDYTFDTTSSATWGSREVGASTKVQYRLGGPRHELTASAAKVGSLDDLSLTASASLDRQELSMIAQLSTLKKIRATVTLKTPFRKYESLGASFYHSGQISSTMNSEVHVQYMTDRYIHGKMEMAFPGLTLLTFRGSLSSDLSGLERGAVTLSHSLESKVWRGSFSLETTVGRFGSLEASYQKFGHMDNIKAESQVTYNGQSLLDGRLSHRLTSSRLQTSMRVLSSALPEVNVEVSHQGDLRRFTSEASATLGGDKVTSSCRWLMAGDNLDLSLSLQSNLQDGSNQAALVLSKVGSLSDVTLQLSGHVNARKAKVVGKLTTSADLSASLEVESPLDGYHQLGASFLLKTGDARDMSLTTAANLERQKIEILGSFSRDSEARGSLDITTPFTGYRQMGAAFSYGEENAMIAGNLQNEKIEAVGRLVRGNGLEGNVDITTPFDGYRQMGVALNYGGENAKISGNLEGQKVEATGRFVNDGAIEGNVIISTPFQGYRRLGASVNFDGESAMISGNLQDKRVEATGRFTNAEVMEGNVDISTPFDGYRQLGASFTMGSDSITANANLQSDRIEASARMDNSDDLTGSVEITTPFSGYTQMGGQFRFAGDLSDVTVTTSGNVEDSKMEMTAMFSQRQNVSGFVRIDTPFPGYSTMGASFAMSEDYSDLTLTAEAFLQSERLQTRAVFNSKEGVSGTISLTTPFQSFQQLEASFKHSGRPSNFNTEGQVTYMDGQTIHGKVSFSNRRLRRLQASAELTTPFRQWERTVISYKHTGNSNQLKCNAKMESSQGQHMADLKVDWSRGQDVQLSVTTPHDGFRLTELTHSLSSSGSSAQWSGALTYGQGQRASSQLTLSYPQGRVSSTFDLKTPFTSDLSATFDLQGDLLAHTRKTTVKYGDRFQLSDDMEIHVTGSPLLLVSEVMTYTLDDVTSSQSMYLRRDGPWNDVILVAKGGVNGEEVAVNAAFKNQFGVTEGSFKVNTPLEGYSDVGASWRHTGDVEGTFSAEGKAEYVDGQEMAVKLDWTRVSWRQLQVSGEVTTPFQDWTQTRAEYRHIVDSDGFAGSAALDYLRDQRLTGDLRVTSSPQPEVTLTLKTPWRDWEELSASGSYVNDGWGKREVSGKLDLGQGYVYTVHSALSAADNGQSFTSRLTTPHTDWHTLEARGSHEGGVANFKSSAYLSAPLLDAVSTSVSLRYNSPFDLTATANLDTTSDLVRGWKVEMVNGERGSQKTSHVIVGWSGDQEVVVDGTWRHEDSWYERHLLADLSISSPFQAARKTSWSLEHQSSQGNYQHKLTGSLNGDRVVDLDLSTVTGDLPKVTLTLSEPYAMQYSVERTAEGAEVLLDWDRNDPTSNVLVSSRFSRDSSKDTSNTQHDLDLKVVNPSLTAGAKYSLQLSPLNTASQGELYWGRGGNRRVFYSLELSDRSRRSSASYEGKVKVGAMSRAVQLSGSVTQSPLSRQMDTTLHWDAERDPDKHVTLQTSWTSGTKNKADVTLKIPSINQELRVQSEVAVNQGRTLLEATTALSYCPESSKVLTFTSTLKDTTGAWDKESSNYTLHLSLTHPHTDLDLALTSHLGASQDRYSAAVDTWYLTAGRRRHNMALRGEIDQLRRQLTMEMVSPAKKLMVKGEVKSVEPYSLSLSNRFDDDATMQTDVTFDANKRAFSLRTKYDLDHPERTLVLNALYVNDTAIKAEVYRDHVTDVITDALVALRLNTSTLLYSRLHWRPQAVSDLQDYTVGTLNEYALDLKQSAHRVSGEVREELTARWTRTVGSLADDLQPWNDLFTSEMDEVTEQLTSLRRQLIRLARRYPLVQDQLTALQEYLGDVSARWQETAERLSQEMKEAVQALARYPVGDYYQQSVNALLAALEDLTDGWLEQLTEAVMSVDNHIYSLRQRSVQLSNSMSEALHNVTHPNLLYLRNSLDPVPYLQAARDRLSSVSLPQDYTAAMYTASSRLNHVMSDVMDTESTKRVREVSNKVYQQGVWAYHYWEVEENLKKHLRSIATLLKEIIQEEVDIYTRHFRFLQDSHVTVWDPEHGDMQAELRLPVAMETLDSLPDMTPLVSQYHDIMNGVPDMDTVRYFYDNYVPQSRWWSADSSRQLNESAPYSEPRDLPKRRIYRGRGPRYSM